MIVPVSLCVALLASLSLLPAATQRPSSDRGPFRILGPIYSNETDDPTGNAAYLNESTIPLFTLLDDVFFEEHGRRQSSSVVQFDEVLPPRNESMGVLEYRDRFPVPPSVETTMSSRRTLYVLGLFELTGPCAAARGGPAERAAARVAIRHVNQRHVIPGYRLEMYDNDTKVSFGIVEILAIWFCE